MHPLLPHVLDRNKPSGVTGDLNQDPPRPTFQQIQETIFTQPPILPKGYTESPSNLESLGAECLYRFKNSGEIQDIDQAINLFGRAVWITCRRDPQLPGRLSRLSVAHHSRFERLGEYRNIDTSINCIFLANALSPASAPDKPMMLANLGSIYLFRYRLLGRVSDIHQAVVSQTEALSLIPGRHPVKPVWLSNLASSYIARFEDFRVLEDIDKAIACLNEAEKLAPADHPSRSMFSNNLGLSHRLRFQRLNNLNDIVRAVQYGTQAVALTPEGHPNKRGQLQNLGASCSLHFKTLGDIEGLNKAIKYLEESRALTPEGHAEKSTMLNDLGLAYRYRFEHLNNLEDIHRSVGYHTESVSLTPDRHAKLPNRLSNLGFSHWFRYQRLSRRPDIDQSINYLTRAFDLTPKDHADLAERAAKLGSSHLSRIQHSGLFEDFSRSLDFFRTAAESSSSYPKSRFQASRLWAWLSSLLDGSAWLSAYTHTMNLVPQLIWLGDTVASRFDNIESIADVAAEAASVAIAAGELNLALEWIEQGRSIVWKQILQLRTPLEELEAVDPVLAQKLRQARQILDQAEAHTSASEIASTNNLTLEEAAQRRRRSAENWSQLLERAQQLPGFGDFMKPQKSSDLMLAAQSGVVVVINIYDTRCDALVLSSDNPIVLVQLPQFSLEKATRARTKILGFLRAKGLLARGFKAGNTNADVDFGEVLALLWSDVAKPILDVLGYTNKAPMDELPHITWCTTGPLSFLPLHAAGLYDQPGANVMDLAVCSYTPNLSTLIPPTATASNFSGILAVGQSAAQHGLSELPGTVAELNQIKAQAGKLKYTQLDDENATVEAVLSALDKHSWVHFACHAKQNSEDPISSALYLHDGALDLATITRKSDKRGGLAFLSACQTATGDEKIPDESVHLAAGMIMAGYSTVIATMWSVVDDDAPLIAREVYAQLLEGGEPDMRKTSEALHSAVQSLRAKVGDNAFMRWVPYVHLGI